MPNPPAIRAELLGRRFAFQADSSLFSADRVDDGTRLLLDALPPSLPASVLDMGCGYGALGLPVAARHPNAACLLVDRNTLAVEYARRNAAFHALPNVDARPSLGYRDLGPRQFDWVLCNVPARIGEAGVRYLLGAGASRLETGGELRAVVIRDLRPTVERVAAERGWPLQLHAEAARHAVYGLPPLGAAGLDEGGGDHEALYLRDRVWVGNLELQRPHDISEEPAHLTTALPLLMELLPQKVPGSAFVWKGAYGAAALALASRADRVIAADPDLLATTYVRRNAEAAGRRTVETRDAFSLRPALRPEERFRAFVGELRPGRDALELEDELVASAQALEPGGSALWLGLTGQGRTLLARMANSKEAAATPVASRGAYTVWRVRAVQPARRAGKKT